LLKKERNYRITSNVITSVLATGLFGWLIFLNKDQKNETMLYMSAAAIGLGIPIFVTKGIAEKTLAKAVHNYNLFVMGIQIK